MIIFIFILEILVILTFLFLGIFKKVFITKKTILFTIPIFLIALTIYSLGYVYTFKTYDVLSFVECLKAAIKTFALDIKTEFVQSLSNSNVLFKIDVFMINILGGLSLVSSILAIFKIAIFNFFKTTFKLMKGCDIVCGYCQDSVEYCKNNKKSILFIDISNCKISSDEKKNLFLNNVCFVTRPLSKKTINLLLRKKQCANIIFFDDKKGYLDRVFDLASTLSETDKIYKLYIETNSNNRFFIEKIITERKKLHKNLSCFTFDKYELISRKFSLEHNIAKYLPTNFIDKSNLTILPNKKINVNFIGFGKTAFALFRSIVLNNQFVKIENDKFLSYKIHINLYDSNPKTLNNQLLNYIDRLKNEFNNELEFPELTFTINKESFDVKNDFNKILKLERGNDVFNMFIISLYDNFDNVSLASTINKYFKKPNNIIFYNVDDKTNIYTNVDEAIAFGFKNSILKHSILISDNLNFLAEETNKNYSNLKKVEDPSLLNLPYIEKMSNYYANINLRFKLNLLNLDITNEDSNYKVSKDKFYSKYLSDKKTYKDKYYLSINKRSCLAYQEHLRWCMFYLFNEFKPMDIKNISIVDNKLVTKNVLEKTHCCLTTYYCLDKLHKIELEILKQNKIKASYSDVETYKYDFQIVDNIYNSLQKTNLYIIPLIK